MKLTDEEKGRLTKKAQRYIDFLEREMGIAHRQVTELNGFLYQQGDTNISFHRGFSGDNKGIPTGSTVAFEMKPGRRKWSETIEAQLTSEGKLRISGTSRLVISPSASNVIDVTLSES